MSPTKSQPQSEAAKRLPKLDWGTFEKISRLDIAHAGTIIPKADDPNHEYVEDPGSLGASPECCGFQDDTKLFRTGHTRGEVRMALELLLEPHFDIARQLGIELILGGRGVLNLWQCVVLPKMVPKKQQDFRKQSREANWEYAIGFLDTRPLRPNTTWRIEHFRLPPNRGKSHAFDVFWKWIRQSPSEKALHSYIVYALIALGQFIQHKCWVIYKRPRRYHVRLLFRRPDEREHLYLYEADMSNTFLTTLKTDMKLDQVEWPKIECRRIRYEPAHQFRDALLNTLIPEPQQGSSDEEAEEKSD